MRRVVAMSIRPIGSGTLDLLDLVVATELRMTEEDVTGILFTFDRACVHFLEGNASGIQAVLDGLSYGSRHRQAMVIYDDVDMSTERLYASRRMGLVAIDAVPGHAADASAAGIDPVVSVALRTVRGPGAHVAEIMRTLLLANRVSRFAWQPPAFDVRPDVT